MRQKLWLSTCAAIAFAATIGLVAQQPPDPQSPQPPQPAAQSAAAKTVTVTGCIQRAQQAPTGTAGEVGAAASASETKFVLTNAALSTSGTAGTSGAVPAPATMPTTAIASEYRLDADEAKLTPHIGHKVEVTGTVEPAARAAQPSAQPPAASAANAPKLKVDSVKMVSATCPS